LAELDQKGELFNVWFNKYISWDWNFT
jgi:hypothetical protein